MKVLLTALLIAATFPADAQGRAPLDATVEAKSHFRRGSALYREARYRDAIVEFEEANRLRPHGVIFYNLAQCHERLGDIPAALRAYHEYLRALPQAEDHASVNAAMANLEARLGAMGVQQLLVYTDPPGAEVILDGMARGRTPFAAVLPHGAHRVTVLKPGFGPVTREAVLASDRSLEIDVALAPARASTSPPRSGGEGRGEGAPIVPDLTPASLSSTSSALALSDAPRAPHRTIAPRWKWIAAGASAVALTAGAIYGLSARSASADLRGAEHDSATATRLAQSASSRAHTANVLYGVGAAAGAAGLGIFAYEVAF
jgi:tetratricopeptide (TPR) repeat protein